jgi:cytochrome c oxidase accessory protein FixG
MELPTRPNLDSVATIRDDGSRRFVYTADVRGFFTRIRGFSALVLIAVYLLLPWVRVRGYPAVFLDVASRRFHLFGLTLAVQDMWLLFFLITGLGFSLFFVTALLGRIWCGWACPQTIFLDHVFRRIERWIEGDSVRRRMLAGAPWTAGKASRGILKHALYIAVSAAITHLFLAYFVSIPQVWTMMSAAPGANWSAFLFIAVATGILYFNFAWFREQLCIVICPYGRLQSALVDDHTLIIGYDKKRGEPRMTLADARSKPAGATAGPGDCVACSRCVQVCPTAIDIRDGLQLECIGCAACIDACDEVMTRLRRPRGLIRYDSLAGFTGRRTRWLRPRTAIYGILLLVGSGVATWALSTVHPESLGVTRMTGAPYFVDSATVRNQFFVRIVNKRTEPARFALRLEQAPAGLRQTGLTDTIEIPPLGEIVEPLILQMARGAYQGPFTIRASLQPVAGGRSIERQVEFLGPDVRLLREEEEERRADNGTGVR